MSLCPEGYMTRLVENRIDNSLKAAGAISVEGPKGCGKTWCSRRFAESEFSLVDPTDNYLNLRIAREDPAFVLDGEAPHLIDEWQDVSKIWDAVRFEVDKSRKKGRFILCGSPSVDKADRSHSGAMRIIDVPMRTMSLFESEDSTGDVSLKGLFDGDFRSSRVQAIGLEGISWLIIRGGWPGLLDADETSVSLQLKDYIDKLCEEDAQKIDGKHRNVANLKRLFRSLARNESSMVAMTKLTSDIAEYENQRIDQETVAEYIDVFDKLHLIANQSAYSPRYRSPVRVGKSPKRHLTDPSLAAAALGLNRKALMTDLNTFGSLFESLCERDLAIYADAIGGELYHYHDHSGREIDAVVEIKNEGWGAFEIKLGQASIDQAAENLKKIRNFMHKDDDAVEPRFLCIITGTGTMAYRREDGVYVVPITALGP
mgnify:CR=1 FL=1